MSVSFCRTKTAFTRDELKIHLKSTGNNYTRFNNKFKIKIQNNRSKRLELNFIVEGIYTCYCPNMLLFWHYILPCVIKQLILSDLDSKFDFIQVNLTSFPLSKVRFHRLVVWVCIVFLIILPLPYIGRTKDSYGCFWLSPQGFSDWHFLMETRIPTFRGYTHSGKHPILFINDSESLHLFNVEVKNIATCSLHFVPLFWQKKRASEPPENSTARLIPIFAHINQDFILFLSAFNGLIS